MGWGSFEGRTLAELRARQGGAMRDLEAMGIDFQPPGGESPRLVAKRLAECMRELAPTGRDHLIVAHKGVLRASLVLALDWDMRGRPPVRYEPDLALVHDVTHSGALTFVAAVPLCGAAP
jgi:probable phosphoglycerate mutase